MKKIFTFLVACLLSTGLFAQTEIFISEIVEGSGNNKAIELFNPTNAAIDLSAYTLVRFSNGDVNFTAGGSTVLSGTIQPMGTFVIVNGQTETTSTSPACDPALQALVLEGGPLNGMLDGAYPAPTYLNGNDAIGLLKTVNGSFTAVDLFGQYGLGADITDEVGWSDVEDSVVTYNGANGTVTGTIEHFIVPEKDDTGSGYGPFWLCLSKDHSLVRKPTVQSGVTANPSPTPPNLFNIGLEWDTLAGGKDIWTDLGLHTYFQTSIDNFILEANVNVFPNPAIDAITLNTAVGFNKVELLNYAGQVLYTKNFTGNETNAEIRFAEQYAAGVYMLRISFVNEKQLFHKLLIIK